MATYFFLCFPPKNDEKELFQVVVHENQFTVSARRVHQILHPQQPYESWMQVAILRAVLEHKTDYWYRERMHDNPKRRHHSIVFNLLAIKKLCALYMGDAHATEEQEVAAKHLFKEVSNRQQLMLQTSMNYISSYWVYHLPWKPLGGQRIYPLKKVLKSVDAVPAFELVLRQQFPYHITPFKGQPYISYDLVQLLHMRHWVKQSHAMLLSQHPFEGAAAQ